MALSTQIQLKVTTTETLTGDDLIANSQLIHSGYDTDTTLTGSTTPDVTKAAYQTVALSGGAATVDLTSLLLNGQAVTLDGLQPRAFHFKNTGAADMTIAKGASNGFTGLGASFSVTLKTGQEVAFYLSTNATAVSSTVKTLDLSGTGTDTLQLSVVAGT